VTKAAFRLIENAIDGREMVGFHEVSTQVTRLSLARWDASGRGYYDPKWLGEAYIWVPIATVREWWNQ
jgi:hypothetical protein